MVWAYETLAAMPEWIVHECTSDFDYEILQTIFGAVYMIMTFVFSPTDMGIPASRPRRYTIMVLKAMSKPLLSFDKQGFGSIAFARCVLTGHVFFSAGVHIVGKYVEELAASLHFPARKPDGSVWSMREVLSAARRASARRFERYCEKRKLPKKYIVNLTQSLKRFSHTEIVPTLLCKTSLLWDMLLERLLVPLEYLSVMCIPVFDDTKPQEDMFPVERLARSGVLESSDITYLAGNGMSLAAIGAVLLHLFSTVQMHTPCTPAASSEDRT